MYHLVRKLLLSSVNRANPSLPILLLSNVGRLTERSSKAAEVVHGGCGREVVHTAEARASTCAAISTGTLSSYDGCSRGSGSSCAGCCCAASGLDGDGGGCGCGARIDVLDSARGTGSVEVDCELLVCNHCLIARGLCVDGEDHADAAVRANFLFAVEPFEMLVGHFLGLVIVAYREVQLLRRSCSTLHQLCHQG